MNFRPIRTQILIEYVENKPVGEILLPEHDDKMDFSVFIVRAVGEGFLTHGGVIPLPVRVGDKVKMKGSAKGNLTALEPWFVDNKKYAVCDIEHVLGVWEGELPAPEFTGPKIVTANAVDASGKQILQ